MRRASGLSRSVLHCGPVRLDTRSHSVECDGDFIELTAFEYKVLEYLMMNAGKVVPKGELVEHVYDEDLDPDSNVLEVLIGRLRRKLDPERRLNPIETRRGQGYRFRFNHDEA